MAETPINGLDIPNIDEVVKIINEKVSGPIFYKY